MKLILWENHLLTFFRLCSVAVPSRGVEGIPSPKQVDTFLHESLSMSVPPLHLR